MALLVENIKQSNSLSLPVNLSDMFALLSNDVICQVAFRKKYSGDEKGKRFKELIKQLMELLDGFHVEDYIPCLAWVHRLNGFDAQVYEVAKDFDKFLDCNVEDHANGFNIKEKRYEDGVVEDHANDFVDVLLQIQNDEMAGYCLDRQSIKAILLVKFSLPNYYVNIRKTKKVNLISDMVYIVT